MSQAHYFNLQIMVTKLFLLFLPPSSAIWDGPHTVILATPAPTEVPEIILSSCITLKSRLGKKEEGEEEEFSRWMRRKLF